MMENDWEQCTGIKTLLATQRMCLSVSVCQHLPKYISHNDQSSAYITHSAKSWLDSQALYHCRMLFLTDIILLV